MSTHPFHFPYIGLGLRDEASIGREADAWTADYPDAAGRSYLRIRVADDGTTELEEFDLHGRPVARTEARSLTSAIARADRSRPGPVERADPGDRPLPGVPSRSHGPNHGPPDGGAMDPAGSIPVALLEGLPDKVRDRVINDARRRTYFPGEVVVREGHGALNLFIIAAGHARIEKAGVGVVGRFGPGDFFGEFALLGETDRTATVIAEDELICHLIPAWEFKALLREHPVIALPMLDRLIARLHGR